MSQEFTDIPWGIGKEVLPQAGEKFNPFIPVRIVYPQPSTLADLLRDPNQQRQYRFEEGIGEKDFVRVVIDNTGHTHWRYNSYIKEDGKRVKKLRHFGGIAGSSGLQTPLDQIDRILDRIMGFEVELDSQDRQIATPRLTFSAMSLGFTLAKEQVRVPGEIDWVAQCLELTDGVLREMAGKRDWNKMRGSSRFLELLQNRLRGRFVPSLELAAENLDQASVSAANVDVFEALNATIRTRGNFLDRSRELTYMTRGLIQRRTAVSGFLAKEQVIITNARQALGNVIRDWESGLGLEALRGLIARFQRNIMIRDLAEVVVEPYKSRAQKVLRILDTERLVEEVEDFETVAGRWRQAMQELQAGQRHIKTT